MRFFPAKLPLLACALAILGAACAPATPDFSSFASEKIKLKHPVVLIHGASMGGAWLRIGPLHFGHYWQFIPEFIEANGNQVGVAQLSSNSAIAERALILKDFLAKKFPGKKVNLVAHSLGGLDARFLASVLKSDQIASITGIATPHYGSPLADWAYDEMERQGFWYWFMRFFNYDLRYRRFLPELRTDYMTNTFNQKVPDAKGVKYYSVLTWGEPGTWSLSPMLYVPYWYTKKFAADLASTPLGRRLGIDTDQRNDGLVPLRTQVWGETIAELPLDHLAQINHHILRPWNGEASLRMYHMILKRLAQDGL